ncbi:hypothetical protein V5F59_04460 [Xanthobacter autotrophicus DSM 431]|uniref:hypothetical protein n=1 Tax=Xanthobacter nonsaccharivorans TaxID=3119912 RepID=UPI0037270477
MTATNGKRLKAVSALFNFPKALRDDILDLPGFKQAFDLPAEAELTFGVGGLSFLRSSFFNALRALYADRSQVETVASEDGRSCELSLKADGDRTVVACRVGGEPCELPGFTMVSPQASDRLAEFDRIAERDFIHDVSSSEWRQRITDSPLSDEEVSQLMGELEQSPIRVREKIRAEVELGKSSIPTVVPQSRAYYQRLIGPSLGHSDLAKFVSGPCKAHIEELLRWEPAVGFAFALLVAAGHSTISELVDVSERPTADLVAAYDWLADRGDRFSQVAGVEIGIRLIAKHPEIEDSLIRMIEEMRDENLAATDSRFALSASLFVLVDGELSRRSLMIEEPPYWRRLAALAQAAMFERELVLSHVQAESFIQWATMGRGSDFFMQGLADLRVEPRWLPDFMSPERLKDEAISRMVAAGDRLKDDEGSEKFRTLLKGTDPEGLRARVTFPQSFLPGSLEGNTVPMLDLPAELVDKLRGQEDAAILSSQSLAGLVNSAFVFRITEEHSRLAAEALKKVRHQVAMGSGASESFAVLIGLATVAAVTRATELAKDVRILARVLRRRSGTHYDVDDLMRVGLIASAANPQLTEWCESVGEWFVEIAQEEMSAGDAGGLRHYLQKLCTVVPELWRYAAKADAALAAVAQAA